MGTNAVPLPHVPGHRSSYSACRTKDPQRIRVYVPRSTHPIIPAGTPAPGPITFLLTLSSRKLGPNLVESWVSFFTLEATITSSPRRAHLTIGASSRTIYGREPTCEVMVTIAAVSSVPGRQKNLPAENSPRLRARAAVMFL